MMVLVLVLLLFGGSKLPQLARNLGKAQREFKQALEEGTAEAEEAERTQTAT